MCYLPNKIQRRKPLLLQLLGSSERFLQDQSWQMQVSCPSSSSLRYVFHLFVLFDPIIPLPHLQAGVVSKGPFFLPLTSWEQRSRRAPQRAGRTKRSAIQNGSHQKARAGGEDLINKTWIQLPPTGTGNVKFQYNKTPFLVALLSAKQQSQEERGSIVVHAKHPP